MPAATDRSWATRSDLPDEATAPVDAVASVDRNLANCIVEGAGFRSSRISIRVSRPGEHGPRRQRSGWTSIGALGISGRGHFTLRVAAPHAHLHAEDEPGSA